jgi:hypothetical protein
MTTLSVGGDIQAYCGKCKSVLTHTIVALKGTRAARTDCQTCGSTHAYRKNPPDTKAKKRSQFEDAMDGRDVAKAIPYRVNRKFNQQDVIKHKTFGIGVVTRVVTEKKMEVLFEDSTKLLICGQ